VTFYETTFVTCAYALMLALVAWLTRAGGRRMLGAIAGGIVSAFLGLSAIAIAESMGWWQVPAMRTVPGRASIFLGFAVSLAPIYPITWRIARRFGVRGLMVCLAVAMSVGPLRDYYLSRLFPHWISFSPGIAPALAVAATYGSWVAVGHAVMRLVAGPATRDRLK
jgi:hypothetical protein